MINRNELRVGNTVLLDNEKFVSIIYHKERVARVLVDKEQDVDVTAVVDLDRLYPIELTEEILLKCGFVEEFKSCYINDNRFVIFKNIHNNVVGLDHSSFYYSKANGVLHLERLHQLQNLYFALTGKELNYFSNKI